MRTPCAGRFARFLLASICMGSVLSLAMAMLSARDLSRCPSMPGSGIIGGRGYTEDALDRIWRTLAPRSWRAWDDGSGFDWPTRGLAHEIGIIVHPALSEGWKTGEPGHALTGDGWIATVVAGGGFYDLAWVARLDEVRRKGAGDPNLNALEPWEVSKRLEAGETLVTDAPWWIPSDLPRECEGILPGRSGRVGRHFRMVDVPEDAWMQEMVWSAEADRLRLAAIMWSERCVSMKYASSDGRSGRSQFVARWSRTWCTRTTRSTGSTRCRSSSTGGPMALGSTRRTGGRSGIRCRSRSRACRRRACRGGRCGCRSLEMRSSSASRLSCCSSARRRAFAWRSRGSAEAPTGAATAGTRARAIPKTRAARSVESFRRAHDPGSLLGRPRRSGTLCASPSASLA